MIGPAALDSHPRKQAVDGIAAGLREVERVLRPGGLGVFLEPVDNSEGAATTAC